MRDCWNYYHAFAGQTRRQLPISMYGDAIARRRYYYSVQQLKRADRCSGETQQSSGSLQAMMKDIAIYHFFVEGKTHPISPKTLSLYLQESLSFSFLSLFRVSYRRDAGKYV